MGITRTQKLWNKIDQLHELLKRNPHVPLDETRKLAEEMEQLTIQIRFAELRRRLRQHKKATSIEGVSKAKQPKTT